MTNIAFIQKLFPINCYDQVLAYLAAYDTLDYITVMRRYLKLLTSGIFLRSDILVAFLLVSHSQPSG